MYVRMVSFVPYSIIGALKTNSVEGMRADSILKRQVTLRNIGEHMHTVLC